MFLYVWVGTLVLFAQLGETGGGGKAASFSELRKLKTYRRLKLESGVVRTYPGSCSLLILEVTCIFFPFLSLDCLGLRTLDQCPCSISAPLLESIFFLLFCLYINCI